MPMTPSKRCDISFERIADSARLRLSFCHVGLNEEADSSVLASIGTHAARIQHRSNGQARFLELTVQSEGCPQPWGLLIRADELGPLEDLMKDLSFRKSAE